ncbi:MAG: DUF4423 domain-containing protein [Bdellovibrionales bacterium]|jgi:uncharacterized protein (TIGR02147 family)|nr:DUF4423 domain-containing protein [Bdellovibrionales bacterium]
MASSTHSHEEYNEDQSYQQIRLKIEFNRAHTRHRKYSLRAYANRLGLHPGTLSGVMSGKRSLPVKSALLVAEKLQLKGAERRLFVESGALLRFQKKNGGQLSYSQELLTSRNRYLDLWKQYTLIAEWEHAAVLSLMDLEEFRLDARWIAKRLGLTTKRASQVIANLKSSKTVRRQQGEWVRSDINYTTTDDISSQALRDAHIAELELAKNRLETTPISLRQYSSLTLTLNPERLPDAKKMIQSFLMNLAEYLEKDSTQSRRRKGEVYQIGLQMFPLTISAENSARTDRNQND